MSLPPEYWTPERVDAYRELWRKEIELAASDPDRARRILGTAAKMIESGRPMPDPLRLYLADRLMRIAQGDPPDYVLHLKRRNGDRSASLGAIELKMGMLAAVCFVANVELYEASEIVAARLRQDGSTLRKLERKHRERFSHFVWAFSEGLLDPRLYLPTDWEKAE